MRLAVWRCLRGAFRSSTSQDRIRGRQAPVARHPGVGLQQRRPLPLPPDQRRRRGAVDNRRPAARRWATLPVGAPDTGGRGPGAPGRPETGPDTVGLPLAATPYVELDRPHWAELERRGLLRIGRLLVNERFQPPGVVEVAGVAVSGTW